MLVAFEDLLRSTMTRVYQETLQGMGDTSKLYLLSIKDSQDFLLVHETVQKKSLFEQFAAQ